jgi:DNA-binding MarR family transcriptional regulator
MEASTIANIVGAFAQAVSDEIQEGIAGDAGQVPNGAAALVHLSKYPNAPIDGLRSPLRLSHPGCVRVVDRLEAERLVVRGTGTDRRSRPLRLTPAGEVAARSVLRKRRGSLRHALGALSAREQEALAALAAKVLTALVHDEPQALAVCRVCDYDACPDSVCPVAKALGG